MENLDISRRSVFRLLASLDELGFPLTDEQSKAKNEKTYRLAESYVLKLPNMSIPNPNFSNEEARLLLSVLDDCIRTRRTENITLLKSTRQKIMSMVPKGKGRHK
jgi:predicted DNA-binding transcriptional regulator YafY